MLDRRTFITGLGASALVSGNAFARVASKRFEAHEWGTFTSVASGKTSGLDWRPLAVRDDLPSFVYRLDSPGGKGGRVAKVRMETPVIYFYAPKKMKVKVSVDFPEGAITEWYPRALDNGGDRLEWSATVDPNLEEKYAREEGESHYYPARKTGSSPLEVQGATGTDGKEREKFLFYRGVGKFDAPIRFVDGTAKADGIEHVIAFVREGDDVRFAHLDRIDGEASPFSALATGTISDLTARLEKILIGTGLFEDEAKAMIATWQNDWFEEGMRLFYLYPRSATDRVLPIQITPKPEVLVRTLVGRLEVLTPAFRERVLSLAKKLSDPTAKDAAAAELSKSRFAQCILREVDTPEVQIFLATQAT